ncbi:MAG TPA: ATP-binding protein [Pseudacidobacterium sp.]|nr:ATP-binding protein [Pseudacidobacterium sp.]
MVTGVDEAVVRSSVDTLLARVRLRARLRMLWMAAARERRNDLAISSGELDAVLEDPRVLSEREAEFYQTDDAARELSEEISELEREFEELPEWTRVRRQFALSDFEIDLLSLAVAVDVDPSLRRVYAHLQDDDAAIYATPWLAECLFHSHVVSAGPQSRLYQLYLARPADGLENPWSIHAPWLADSHIMLWLAGERCFDPALAMALQMFDERTQQPCLYPEQLDGMMRFVRAMWEHDEAPKRALEIEIIGQRGAGKRTLAGQFAALMGVGLIAVDAEALLGPDISLAAAHECVVRTRRMAGLAGAMLYWHGVEHLPLRMLGLIHDSSGITLFGIESPGTLNLSRTAARHSLHLPVLNRDRKLALWEYLATEPAPHVIEDWTLTPAEIASAAAVAPVGMDAVIAACHESLRGSPAELFTLLPCPFTWDDIILPPHLREHLQELEQQVRLRQPVYEDWGFERLCPLGRGITGMFCGQSGTGKTMAAQVLARSLDMQLYRVDLAGVMNKYIGETEKRLKQVFDACERSNVLLFFDEADALFGQRTQVKDAHDRFANIEIDYLLQRMEQFNGVAILATNRKGDLDKAFLRRIRFIVDFQAPGYGERLVMWRRALANEELLSSVDFEMLADKLNMTGSEIAAAALGAAFLARAEGVLISTNHVLHAARREMSKHGQALRAGQWEG